MQTLRWLLIRWLLVLLPTMAFAQSCPPPPVEPTPEQIQTLMREAKDRGFLWKITKAGRSGYLYGTMHVGKQAWSVPGPRTLAALTASDTIALELDVLDPAVQAQLMDVSRFSAKPLAMPPSLQGRMNALARKVCAPEAMLAKQHPMMQLMTVTLFDARFSELEVAYGNEIFLAGFARGADKTVVSLETVESQMRALLGGDAGETLESVSRAMTVLEQGKTRAITSRMAAAWASGDLRELENYAQWCECANTVAERRALQRLNDERNPGLARRIDKLLSAGKSAFAAVGALHMVGAKALPNLLQELGYQVERVTFEP